MPSKTTILNPIFKLKDTSSLLYLKISELILMIGRSIENIITVRKMAWMKMKTKTKLFNEVHYKYVAIFVACAGEYSYSGPLFHENGATHCTSGETIALQYSMCHGLLIWRNNDTNWPPRTWDLTPLRYYLRIYVEGKVYDSNPQTTHAVKANIEATISRIFEKKNLKLREKNSWRELFGWLHIMYVSMI